MYGGVLIGQERIEHIPFGDFNSWAVRYIKESALIGGKTKTIYVPAPTDTIYANKAFDYSKTIWGVSNAYANVIGVAKAANTTAPERRDQGWCARLDTRMETVKVIGLINIKVVISGSLFLGSVVEPVRSANDPYGYVSLGIPFTKKPKALIFDYKALVSDENIVTKALGLGSSEMEGRDNAQVYLYLQKRWEDEDGNIFAKRIGTVYERISHTTPGWINDRRFDVFYGDLSKEPNYKEYQGLLPTVGAYRSFNSKGELKDIVEVGWGDGNDTPTHLVLFFSSGCYTAFIGHIGNSLWVDNIRLVY